MKRGRESGLSDAIGAIVLVAVVGMGIGLIGMFILSQPVPEKIPALTADITTIGRTVLITHNGGDPMSKDDMVIIVDGDDLKDSFQNLDGTPWSSWAVGDSLLYRVPDGQAMPDGITIFFIGGSSTRIIQSMGVPQSVSAGGLYSTGTTTIPVTTTTTSAPSAPVAGFTGTPVSGNAPLTVVFTDTSTGVPVSWLWDFGDGDVTNVTLQNPVHTYAGAGTYTVTLTASNTGGSDSETRTNYITVSPTAPVADFTGSPTSGTRPLKVVFTDTSTNTPTSWAWVFGDGDTTNATMQNPVHTYAGAGTYTVTLTATNAGGSDPETKTNYITASLPPRTTIFYDGFETSRPSGNGWTETGSVDWGTGYPRIGTYSIRMRGGGTPESIYRTVSTAGYSQIIVSVYLGASSLDSSSEYVEAEYSTDGGGSWTRFGAILNGDSWEDGQLHSFTSGELPAGADDNANFRIRLRIIGSGTGDYGYYDEVLVTGIPN